MAWWYNGYGVGLAIEQSWVRFPVGPLSSYLGYSAFHPSGVGKSSTGLVGWGEGGVRSLMSGGR